MFSKWSLVAPSAAVQIVTNTMYGASKIRMLATEAGMYVPQNGFIEVNFPALIPTSVLLRYKVPSLKLMKFDVLCISENSYL